MPYRGSRGRRRLRRAPCTASSGDNSMILRDPAVLIMARAPRRGEVRRALEPLIGADRCAALQSTLIRMTAGWAHEVADGAVHVAHDPPDAADEIRRLVGPA